jgi:hypothetical protein
VLAAEQRWQRWQIGRAAEQRHGGSGAEARAGRWRRRQRGSSDSSSGLGRATEAALVSAAAAVLPPCHLTALPPFSSLCQPFCRLHHLALPSPCRRCFASAALPPLLYRSTVALPPLLCHMHCPVAAMLPLPPCHPAVAYVQLLPPSCRRCHCHAASAATALLPPLLGTMQRALDWPMRGQVRRVGLLQRLLCVAYKKYLVPSRE